MVQINVLSPKETTTYQSARFTSVVTRQPC